MSQQSTDSDGIVSRRSSIAASAGTGVLTAAVGYLVTYAMIAGEANEVVGDGIATWKGVAWYFYNAHLVDIEANGSVGSFGTAGTVDFIAESGSTSATLLYAVPPLLLLATGALLVVRSNVDELGDEVIVAAPVTIGYALVIGLGAFVTESSSEGFVVGIAFAPQPVPAFVLGVLYPLVFATAGAVIAALVDL
ncbi:hypothetical protein [Halopiger djelfimassiliensis]|uniref:hypothetical protein n=1 Tax=Halopiger djelfimassiliensis TaxID=1293047 RepID=UPI0006775E9F|nr:hypothetical protein [Halopiger djelfimassiliensis]